MTRAASLTLCTAVAVVLAVGTCVSCSDGEQKFEDVVTNATRTLEVAGTTVRLELAIDPTARNAGLMHRTSLDADAGMLFIFPDSEPRTFWMRNTLIPLDIIFLDADGTVQNIEQGAPMVEQPGYHSLRPARMVLEFNAGWAAEHGLKAGDRVEVPADWLELPQS